MKLNRLSAQLALLSLTAHAGQAVGQTDAVKLERVEITGSTIKRVQDEGALPVQVIRASDFVKLGVTTAEQLLQQLSGNGNGIDNLATNQGGDFLVSTAGKPHNNGASSASLRGLGSQYTLVLLNGRRLSTHGLNGQAVDLNGIPLAAIDRVEILKDGASAIYGTDAIGGVINFILKKNYSGLEVTALTDVTQHGGGNISRGSVLFGAGDLSADRYNFMAALTYDRSDRLRGGQRSFHNGNQPDRGLSPDTTGAPYANISSGAGTAISGSFILPGETARRSRVGLLNLQGKCESVSDMYAYRGDVTDNAALNRACSYDYGKQWSLMQPLENINLVTRGSVAVNADTTAYVEVVSSRSKSAAEYTPIQLTSNSYKYPAGGAYYQDLASLAPTLFRRPTDPADGRVVFDVSKPEMIRWRCMACGPRQQETTTDAIRVLAGVDGLFAGWDYRLGVSAAQSKVDTVYGEGNMLTNKLVAAMATGKVNPFLLPGESQSAEAMQLISDASARGRSLYGGKATVTQVDGVISKEIFALPAGNVAAAVGFDLRRETYRYTNGQDQTIEPVNGVLAVPSLAGAPRDIKAVFGELQVPLAKNLDLQLAARYDHYSDVGSTVNPKTALRWQPIKEVLLRGSYSRSFHAPDYDPLYGGDVIGAFNSDINDPVLCPTGKEPTGCGIRPDITTRANPNLEPEKSKQYSVGIVVSPTNWLTVSLDYWKIEISNRISALSGLALINNYERYKQYVKRDPGPEISEVIAPYFNLAGDKTHGVDLNISMTTRTDLGRWTAVLDGTFIDSYKSRISSSDPWVERVNDFGGPDFGYDLKLRWKHTLSFGWKGEDWGINVQQIFNSGYNQEVGGYSGFTPSQLPEKVGPYRLYNLTATYSGFKNLTLTGGIKNLLDTQPPFSGHNVDNVAGAGWDARVGDPRLRSFILRANYKFW